MMNKIGFASDSNQNISDGTIGTVVQQKSTPRKSVVRVYFENRNMTLSYYNDQFDLQCGDLVYVEGKLEGVRGRVVDVNYNFKIKLSDYKRVVSLVDSTVSGQFFIAGNLFVTFDRKALPHSQAATWFKAPPKDDDEFIISTDDGSFSLDDLSGMNSTSVIAQRGIDYYTSGRVKYICIDGTKGYAIVEGGEAYEVEFEYHNGEISALVCSCFCSGTCKHEFAVMLQLKETLALIEKYYSREYLNSTYFAVINKAALFEFAVAGKEYGSIQLG